MAGVACVAALWAIFAHALPPEHEMRRLMLATETAVKAENWREASEYLNRLQVLVAEKPADYLFYRGRVMMEAQHFNEARSALEKYVEAAGEEGQHYKQSLLLITDIEKRQAQSVQAAVTGAAETPVATIESAEGQAGLPDLKKLYLTPSATTALEAHLNSLLGMSAWRGDQRIVKEDAPADVVYKVRAAEGEIHVQESRRNPQGEMAVSTQAIGVYGISPQVRSACEPTAPTCWVYDPRDGSRLLQLGNNRERATEVAQTLGRLIRRLQTPD
ncbi:hypothetical protein BG841_11450 [Marinobacter sp. X15-166B]|nr:hypothetical protein BG841_11450 [Marinobacter sp. X15-166B]